MILVALAVCAPFWWLVITRPLIALVAYGLAIVVVCVASYAWTWFTAQRHR